MSRRRRGIAKPAKIERKMLPPTEPELGQEPTSEGWNWNWLLGGGVIVIALLVLFDLWNDLQSRHKPKLPNSACQEVIRNDAVLTKEQLAKFLTIPERDRKQRVQAIVQQPYCRLPKLQVRSGVEADREAYHIQDDRNVQLVILYEGEEYAGFTISPL